jgi:transposase InsO family protein
VEFATLTDVNWFNHCRLHGVLGLMPPTELEARYDKAAVAPPLAASQ